MIPIDSKTRLALDEFLNQTGDYIDHLQDKPHRFREAGEVDDDTWKKMVEEHNKGKAYMTQCCKVLKYMVLSRANKFGNDKGGNKDFKRRLVNEFLEVLDYDCGIEIG